MKLVGRSKPFFPRLNLLFLWWPFTVLAPQEFLPFDDVHIQQERYIRNFYRADKQATIQALQEDCQKKEKFSFYSCYNLAVLSGKNRKALLEEAVLQNPAFVEATNALKLIDSRAEVPSRLGVVQAYEAMLKFARLKQKTETLEAIQRCIELGLHNRTLYENDPALKWVKNSREFSELMNSLAMEEYSWYPDASNPIRRHIDLDYTFAQHQKKPQKDQPLFHWYEAILQKNPIKAQKMVITFQASMERLEQHTVTRNASRYSIIYIRKGKELSSLRKSTEFIKWVQDREDHYGMELLDEDEY